MDHVPCPVGRTHVLLSRLVLLLLFCLASGSAMAVDTAFDCRFTRGPGISLCIACNSPVSDGWRVRPPGEGGFAKCRECDPYFNCTTQPVPIIEKSYSIKGSCLTTSDRNPTVQQLVRDAAPLLDIARVNPMASAALYEGWVSDNGVKPISMNSLNVVFDTEFSAEDIHLALTKGQFGGKPIEGERFITATSELLSSVGDTTRIYRVQTLYETQDGSRTPSGPAIDIVTEWQTFDVVYDAPAEMTFEVQIYRITGWSVAK